MDIGFELEKIIKKYNLIPKLKNINPFENKIIELIDTIPDGSKACIWAEDEQIREILNIVSSEKICCVIGDKPNGNPNVFGVPIKSASYIKEAKIDIVIVATIRFRDDILRKLASLSTSVKIIDLYEQLDKVEGYDGFKGVNFYMCKEYRELHHVRELYLNSIKQSEKEKYLIELIARHLDIRDFVYAYKFMDEYIEKQFADFELIEQAKSEIQQLIQRIAEDISDKKIKNIVLYYIDAVRNRDVFDPENNMPYIKEFSKRSTTFANAFSAAIDTLMGVFSMCTGKLPLDDKIYDKREISIKGSRLHDCLSANGYKIYNYLTWKNFFEPDEIIQKVRVKSDSDKDYLLSRSLAPRILWDCITKIHQEEQPAIFMLHMFYETHEPHAAGYHEGKMFMHRYFEYLLKENRILTKGEYKKQYNECLNYIDRQIEFYDTIIPKTTIRILFGDHGQPAEKLMDEPTELGSLLSWHDDRIHVPLMVGGHDIEKNVVNDLFSMKNCWQLIVSVIEGELKFDTYEYLPVQFDPIYNRRVLEILKSVNSEEYAKGYKILRSRDFKYVLYDDLDEQLYKLPDEKLNVANKAEYKDVLEEFRRAMSDRSFPAFDQPQYRPNKEMVRRKILGAVN